MIPWRRGQASGASTSAFTDFSGSALGGFTGSNTVISAAGQLVDFRPGKTLWVIFQSTGVGAVTTENIVGCNSGSIGKGWWLTRQVTTGTLFLLSGSGANLSIFTPPTHGIVVVCLVWRASDNHLLYSAGGRLLTDAGAIANTVPVDSSCRSYIGTDNGVLGGVSLASGRVIAFATWSTEASSAQAQAGTYTTGSRYALPSSVTSAAVVDFLASRDFAASSFTTQGSSPVTFAVAGSPALTAVAERRWAGADALTWDSALSTQATSGSTSYRIRDSYARMRGRTDGLYVCAEVLSTLYAVNGTGATFGFYVGGSYSAETSIVGSTPQFVDLQPGAGTGKAIEVWDGPQALTGADDPRLVTTQLALRLPIYLEDGTAANPALLYPTPVQKRLIVVGDSIIDGFYATPFAQKSPTALFRADFPTSGAGGASCYAVGSDSVYHLAHDTSTATATAAAIAAEATGTSANYVYLAIGTNDYGLIGTSAAAFATNLARLLDAIHAALPSALIFYQTPIPRVSPSSESANGAGSTLGDFRTQAATVVGARAWCTLVDGTSFGISGADYYSDGLHLVAAGAVKLKAGAKTAMAY